MVTSKPDTKNHRGTSAYGTVNSVWSLFFCFNVSFLLTRLGELENSSVKQKWTRKTQKPNKSLLVTCGIAKAEKVAGEYGDVNPYVFSEFDFGDYPDVTWVYFDRKNDFSNFVKNF